jgi:hypothetical protein
MTVERKTFIFFIGMQLLQLFFYATFAWWIDDDKFTFMTPINVQAPYVINLHTSFLLRTSVREREREKSEIDTSTYRTGN